MSETQKARIKGIVGVVILSMILPTLVLIALVGGGLGWGLAILTAAGGWGVCWVIAVATKWAWDYPL